MTLTRPLALLLLICSTCTAVAASDYEPPRTADGKPDFTGE